MDSTFRRRKDGGMKAKGAIVTLGWGDTYYFEEVKQAQEVLNLLAQGHRCEKDYLDSKSYLVEKANAEVKIELAYKTLITQEEMQAIRDEYNYRESVKAAEQPEAA